MSFLRIGNIFGAGGLGVLVAASITSKIFSLNLEGTLNPLLFIFVGAGALSLVFRSL
jgi:ABC-type proline/glycine betaine transport system permease subunit